MTALFFALALCYLPSLCFVGPWDHSGDFVRYFALSTPLILIGCFKSVFPLLDNRVRSLRVQCVFLTAVLSYILVTYGLHFFPFVKVPVKIDIGLTTTQSIVSVLKGFNPYTSNITYSYGLGPQFTGYKYGPGMFLLYAPFLVLPWDGLKVLNIIYMSLVCFVSCLLVHQPIATFLSNLRNWLLVSTCILSQEVIWAESIMQGTIDLSLSLLVLIALLCIRRNKLRSAGFFVGLGFASKFPLAFALMCACAPLFTIHTFLNGLALGSIPWMPFMIWNLKGLVTNVLIFHAQKTSSANTIATKLPNFLQLFFKYLPVSAFLVSLYNRSKTRHEKEDYKKILLITLYILAIWMILFRQIHNNHSLWVLPLLPTLILWCISTPHESNCTQNTQLGVSERL